jgi:asparagine synthetase B (glutamine-hydrolysing)
MMDNLLDAHKGQRIKELIEERGCELLYLPPYSADLNPVEEIFSKIKWLLREAEVRTLKTLTRRWVRRSLQSRIGMSAACSSTAVAYPGSTIMTSALVRQAVRKRLANDVPLGAFLLGGVNSSLMVAVMSQEVGTFEAVIMSFENSLYDERPFSRQVAARWGMRLHEHVLHPQIIVDLPKKLWHYGQPLADVSMVPTCYVAQAAEKHVIVILNSDGGDELCGRYN